MIVTLNLDTGFRPVDLEFPTTLRTLVCLGALGERRASPTVGTDAVCSPKVRRRLAVVFGALHHAPALRRALLDLEPGPQHADPTVIHFDNGLQVIEFEDAVPRAAAEFEGNIILHAGKHDRHHGSWCGRREWARAQYTSRRSTQQSGVVPADIELSVALRAPHARRLLLQARPLATVWADAVLSAPRHRHAWRARRSWDDGPLLGPLGEDLEGRSWEGSELAVNVQHGFGRGQPHDTIPRALPQFGRFRRTQTRPLLRRHEDPAPERGLGNVVGRDESQPAAGGSV